MQMSVLYKFYLNIQKYKTTKSNFLWIGSIRLKNKVNKVLLKYLEKILIQKKIKISYIQKEISMKTQLNNMIRIRQYQLDQNAVLGKGATGYVYRGYDTAQGKYVAIKCIEMKNVNNEVTQYLLQAQKKAIKAIKNDFVIKCQDIVQEEQYCYIITQEYSNGTLKDHIKSKGKLNNDEALDCFRKIVNGYCAIIDAHIIHRDLKTANIMLKENGDPVIIDFGYAQMIMGKRPLIKYNVGSPSYMSPQAYLQSRYSQKSDVWALGAILYEMLTGKTLDQGKNIKQYFDVIQHQTYGINIKETDFSDLAKQILAASLQISIQQRATSHRLKYFLDLGLGPLGMPGGKENSKFKQMRTISTPTNNFNNFKNSNISIPHGVKTPMAREYSHTRTFSNSKIAFNNKTNFTVDTKRTSVNQPKYLSNFVVQPSIQLCAYKYAQRKPQYNKYNQQFIKDGVIFQKPAQIQSKTKLQTKNSKKMPLSLLTRPQSQQQINQNNFFRAPQFISSKLI